MGGGGEMILQDILLFVTGRSSHTVMVSVKPLCSWDMTPFFLKGPAEFLLHIKIEPL